MRVALYCRVSTDAQDEVRQVRDLTAAAGRGRWSVVETLRDVASGTRDDRPGLARVLDLARSGQVDAVAVCELSRLSRGGIGATFDIARALDAAGVQILSLAEPWASTEGPTRDLLLAVMGWAAKLERDLLVERTRSGLARARADGKHVGRRPIVNAELLGEIIRLREVERLEWSQVAIRLHHPASSCRKWYSASRAQSRRVINGVPENGALPSAHTDTPPA